ncbi:MAG: prepilin-type N-terminal cleavage/methylation domain-containing protein [candidate division Zixibacteria bacterium]|nr:prepilin-type N-terminal cleavage/methylation domain-containing protein [candidate division Zixibacteria bacterium]
MSIVQLKKFTGNRGFSILEVLIAALITGILATATLQFYSRMHHQAENQYDVSEAQHQCRASLFDIVKTLRMAGFKLDGHPAYEISGDTLAVYFSETQPVDTVVYYLEEFQPWEYHHLGVSSDKTTLRRLMKKRNSAMPGAFADYITSIRYSIVDSANIVIAMTAQTPRADDTYAPNGGYRTFSLAERVNIRNL